MSLVCEIVCSADPYWALSTAVPEVSDRTLSRPSNCPGSSPFPLYPPAAPAPVPVLDETFGAANVSVLSADDGPPNPTAPEAYAAPAAPCRGPESALRRKRRERELGSVFYHERFRALLDHSPLSSGNLATS